MILEEGQNIERELEIIDEGCYSIRAIRHDHPCWPVVLRKKLKDRLIQLNYINNDIAKEDIEILKWHH